MRVCQVGQVSLKLKASGQFGFLGETGQVHSQVGNSQVCARRGCESLVVLVKAFPLSSEREVHVHGGKRESPDRNMRKTQWRPDALRARDAEGTGEFFRADTQLGRRKLTVRPIHFGFELVGKDKGNFIGAEESVRALEIRDKIQR